MAPTAARCDPRAGSSGFRDRPVGLQGREGDLDERRGADHYSEIDVPGSRHLSQQRFALGRVADDATMGRQIGLDASLQVERELGVRPQVRDPAPWEAGPAADDDAPVDVVEDELYPPRQAGLAAGRRDVHYPAVAERVR